MCLFRLNFSYRVIVFCFIYRLRNVTCWAAQSCKHSCPVNRGNTRVRNPQMGEKNWATFIQDTKECVWASLVLFLSYATMAENLKGKKMTQNHCETSTISGILRWAPKRCPFLKGGDNKTNFKRWSNDEGGKELTKVGKQSLVLKMYGWCLVQIYVMSILSAVLLQFDGLKHAKFNGEEKSEEQASKI